MGQEVETILDVSIVMPCLNEAETLATCIRKAQRWGNTSSYTFEIVVADNGSTDGSQKIALDNGARVVDVSERGYGSALYYGCMSAQGQWIIMGDADDSYDFSRLDAFVDSLASGNDLVLGNRFEGGIEPGAMPWKNRYIGNPALSLVGRLLYRAPARDFHCGLRALTKEAFNALDLRTSGMEFASEMVMKAALNNMSIAEVPTTLSRDGRSRPPHLRPWRDGWRHLRFLLLLSPKWLFKIPGTIVLAFSLALYAVLLLGPLNIGPVTLDMRTLWLAQAGALLGYMMLLMGEVAHVIGVREGYFISKSNYRGLRMFSPEVGVLVSFAAGLGGLSLAVFVVTIWGSEGFGPLYDERSLRIVSLSTTLILASGITFIFSLIFGFLLLPVRRLVRSEHL